MRSGEFATIGRLSARFERMPRHGSGAGVILGIGDDAALLAPPRGTLVWTVDAQVEGTHFDRAFLSWDDVGYRSFMAAASDLAAMGASPWCALGAWVLEPDLDDEEVDAIARGQDEASDELAARIVGGNLARGDRVSFTTTVLGTAAHPVTRDGAREGDGLYIAGDLGLAASGLVVLQRGLVDPRFDAAVHAWRRPRARIAEGIAMSESAHAAIDVSDGLAQDVAHVARSSGVRAVLDEGALVAHADTSGLSRIAVWLEVDAMDLMLHGGEDYALVAASDVPLAGFWRAGTFVRGEGVALKNAEGGERELPPRGYDHFAK